MIVYLVTNLVNGARYVGVTNRSLDRRWYEHINRSRQNAKFKLGRAIQKYGPSSFKIETLAELDDYSDLLEAERIFVANLGTFSDRHYNMTPGGETAPTLVKEIALRGGATRSLTRRGANHPLYGKKHSPETREKRSAALKLAASKPENKAKRSEISKRSWQDPEIRARRIAALKGKPKPPRSEQTRMKMAAAKRGCIASLETRLKLSAAMRDVWAQRKRMKVENAVAFEHI